MPSISRAGLPASMAAPVVSKITVARSALLTFTVASTSLDEQDFSRFVDNDLAKALLAVKGVASVKRVGGIDREVHIDLIPAAMASLGVAPATVSAQLEASQLDSSGGQGEIAGQRQSARTLGGVKNAEQIAAMTIALGDRRLTLLYAGPAHSSSDMMMMVEPDGVLFAGDIVQNGRIPFMNSDDVSTTQWLAALGEVEKLDPRVIIPGHGRTLSEAKQAIAFTRDYIQYLRGAMAAAVQNWTDFDVAYREADWSKYREFPAFASNNRGNAYRIFLELEQSQFKAAKP